MWVSSESVLPNLTTFSLVFNFQCMMNFPSGVSTSTSNQLNLNCNSYYLQNQPLLTSSFSVRGTTILLITKTETPSFIFDSSSFSPLLPSYPPSPPPPHPSSLLTRFCSSRCHNVGTSNLSCPFPRHCLSLVS